MLWLIYIFGAKHTPTTVLLHHLPQLVPLSRQCSHRHGLVASSVHLALEFLLLVPATMYGAGTTDTRESAQTKRIHSSLCLSPVPYFVITKGLSYYLEQGWQAHRLSAMQHPIAGGQCS